MEQELLFKLLERSLNYTPIVYKQSSFNVDREAFDNQYTMEYKFPEIPDDCLLFFTPIMSCTGASKLNVRTPSVDGTTYVDHNFDILVETNDGKARATTLGDIIAYRMCFFRFKKGTNKIILCNSPLYNEAAFSSLTVTNAEFQKVPTVNGEKIAMEKALIALEERVFALEKKIKFGTGDPEEALANEPSGTLFIQVEED